MTGLEHVFFAGTDVPPGEPGFLGSPRKRLCGRRIRPLLLPCRRNRVGQRQVLSTFLRLILEHARLAPEQYQANALNRRLPACLRVLRASSEEEAAAALWRTPELLPAVLSALLVGVSGFLRDPAVFEHLRQSVLPAMLNKRDGVSVYSLGCSSGQELYSVAMLLYDLDGLQSSHLLGVDCRADAIAQARSGWYHVSDLQPLPGERWRRHFEIDGPRVRVSAKLRNHTSWQVADLGGPPESGLWDVILFRNVAIYLTAEVSGAAWRRLDRQLKPGGVLVTGKADRPPASLNLKREFGCVYRKPEL